MKGIIKEVEIKCGRGADAGTVILLTAVLGVLTWRSGDVQTGTDYLIEALGTLTR